MPIPLHLFIYRTTSWPAKRQTLPRQQLAKVSPDGQHPSWCGLSPYPRRAQTQSRHHGWPLAEPLLRRNCRRSLLHCQFYAQELGRPHGNARTSQFGKILRPLQRPTSDSVLGCLQTAALRTRQRCHSLGWLYAQPPQPHWRLRTQSPLLRQRSGRSQSWSFHIGKGAQDLLWFWRRSAS